MSFAAKIWLIVLIAVILITCISIPFSSLGLVLGGLAILVSATGFAVSLGLENERRYKKRVAAMQRQMVEEEARKKAEAKRRAQEKAEKEARMRAETAQWIEENGYMSFSLEQTTFSNEDKSSRQKILSAAYDETLAHPGCFLDAQLERCQIAGEDAIRVLLFGQCVGIVPSNFVNEVSEIMDDAQVKQLNVDYLIEPGHKRRIYTATLTISCWKHP